jgi:HEAT repeat protein
MKTNMTTALRRRQDSPKSTRLRGAEALRGIVADEAFDPDTRFEAAARLAEVDEAQAAEALRVIVADDAFDPDIRSEAAARLAEVDPAKAAAPFPGFADVSPQLAVRRIAAKRQRRVCNLSPRSVEPGRRMTRVP